MSERINIFDTVAEPTAEKTPGKNTSSFDDDFTPEPQPVNTSANVFDSVQPTQSPAPQPVNKANVFDEAENDKVRMTPGQISDMGITFLDSAQSAAFITLHSKKMRNKMFADKAEFKQSIQTQYLTEEQLQGDTNLIALKAKNAKFTSQLERIRKAIYFTPAEEEQLRTPLEIMVKNSNLDLPPGLALGLALTQILSSRVVDLLD